MVNLNSVGRSFYVLSNILLGIKHKKGNEKVHQGKKSLLNKYLIPTMLRQRVTITMFDISVCWQSLQSATQPSSSVCRMAAVSRSPGPATERRTVWMPVMRGTVRQVILSSNFLSQNNIETFSHSRSLRLFRAGFQAICKLKPNYLFITCKASLYLFIIFDLVMTFIFSLHSAIVKCQKCQTDS